MCNFDENSLKRRDYVFFSVQMECSVEHMSVGSDDLTYDVT